MSDRAIDGGCACGGVRYRLQAEPMFVHCCHCSWCQRETGSAFALNALIEADRLSIMDGEPERVATPSASGRGQIILRCPRCRLALWSHYGGAGAAVAFVRVGTLDEPQRCPPDVHIFTSTKLPWVVLDPAVPAFEAYYSPRELWSPDGQRRYREAKERCSGD